MSDTVWVRSVEPSAFLILCNPANNSNEHHQEQRSAAISDHCAGDEADRLMMDDYGIDLARMSENAGRNLAHLAQARFLNGAPRGRRVVMLTRTGGHGGGALVCARRLYGYGAQVHVLAATPDDAFSAAAAQQLGILRRVGVAVSPADAVEHIARPDPVIDGLIGYSLRGAPRRTVAALIHRANATGAPVLALIRPPAQMRRPATRSSHRSKLRRP